LTAPFGCALYRRPDATAAGTPTFLAGPWPTPRLPVITIQPEGLAFVVATIEGETAPLDGSASFDVILSSTSGSETAQDSGFAFIATPSS
jgi:hypothetical protein